MAYFFWETKLPIGEYLKFYKYVPRKQTEVYQLYQAAFLVDGETSSSLIAFGQYKQMAKEPIITDGTDTTNHKTSNERW